MFSFSARRRYGVGYKVGVSPSERKKIDEEIERLREPFPQDMLGDKRRKVVVLGFEIIREDDGYYLVEIKYLYLFPNITFVPGLEADKIPNHLKQIAIYAEKCLSSDECMKFLWDHTRSEDQYHYVVRALRFFADIGENLGEWMGTYEVHVNSHIRALTSEQIEKLEGIVGDIVDAEYFYKIVGRED